MALVHWHIFRRPRLLIEQVDNLSERDFLGGREYRALETTDSLSTDELELFVDYRVLLNK